MHLLSNKYALNRIISLRPSSAYYSRIPSIRQCVGTNRLWGAMLGKALFDDLEGDASLQDLVDIAILSRAILVLEDHTFDEFINNNKEKQFITDWIDRIEEDLLSIYQRINEDVEDYKKLRLRTQAEVQRRSQGILLSNVFNSSIEKCLIFFNPYRLKIAQHTKLWSERLQFLKLFFFACQLLDDYQDLSEDRHKKINNNIFYEGLSTREIDLIENKRLNWLRSLLMQININLCRPEIEIGVVNSQVFKSFLDAAIEYLEEMLKLQSNYSLAPLEPHNIIKFEDWEYNPLMFVNEVPFPNIYEKYIRPEFMQTYSKGHRDINCV